MVGASFASAVAEVLRAKKGITAVGNAQIDTAQSQFGGAAALFDGNGDYLTSAAGAVEFGSGDLTIEGWIRLNGNQNTRHIMGVGTAGNPGRSASIFLGGTQKVEAYFSNSGSGLTAYNLGNTVVTANTWHHIAMVRSGTSVQIYLNGVADGVGQVGSATGSAFAGQPIYIGSDNIYHFSGWLDEMRFSNIARYTANFTPSTTPFVNDANTLLLIHANGTDGQTFFEDDNGIRAQQSVIAIGNAQISTAQSQFGGSSALFDGSGDYLEVAYSSSLGINSGNFTVEFWYRHPQTGIDGTFGDHIIGQASVGGNTGGWVVRAFANKLTWVWDNIGGYDVATFDPAANTWYHVAFVRSGTGMTCYVNGTSYAVTGFANNTNVSTNPIRIGKIYIGQNDDFLGNIDEVRISNTARYTSGFTSPTEPFVNDANTVLLLHMDGTNGQTVFRDDNGARSQKGITAVGNAQVDTAQSKFGGAAALFDGSGDRLIANSIPDLPSDLTIEFWYRHNTFGGQAHFVDARLAADGSVNKPTLFRTTSNTLDLFYSGNVVISGAWTPSSGVWYHISLVRSSGIVRIYVDGTQLGSNWSNSQTWTSSNYSIGDYIGGGFGINGHIDDFRISITARYTANFTAPTAPFQNDANTLLLLHMDGTDASTVFTDDNGIAPYTP
jgi:hypothetical protein